MPKQSPAAYTVTVTGVRNPPSSGPPKKNQLWDFTQMVWSSSGHSGALSAMLDKFFDFYPDSAVLLPVGEKGGKYVTKDHKGSVGSLLQGKETTKRGDYELESDDAVLRVVKMRALSGETPHKLTPSSEKDYSDRLQHNTESYRWWMDGIVQMPSPIYVQHGAEANAPASIRYRGKRYRRIAVTDPGESLDVLKTMFSGQMEAVVDQLMEISASLMEAGTLLEANDASFADTIIDSARKAYKELLPGILGVYDVAKLIRNKM